MDQAELAVQEELVVGPAVLGNLDQEELAVLVGHVDQDELVVGLAVLNGSAVLGGHVNQEYVVGQCVQEKLV